MNKTEIAHVLVEIGTLLELKGENPFKVRAYSAGARAIEGLEKEEFEALVSEGRLQSVKGIGEALSSKIAELHGTGRLEFLDHLKASIEPGLVEMLKIPGLGPKKIAALRRDLGVTSVSELEKACKDGRVAALAGFGDKTQEKILTGIRNREAYSRRHLWWDAVQVAEPVVAGLRALRQVSRAEIAGSLRRGLETIGDLDFIVAAADPTPVVDWFAARPGVREVTAKGETKASVRLEGGLQADLRIVPADQFAFALHHFTGSKDHNVQMRQRALDRGMSLSEWGLVKSAGEGTARDKAGLGQGVPAADEKAVFRALGLAFIPPELREGMGEIAAAERGDMPTLVELADIRGAFHNHTSESDGSNTLREMAAAAQALGWDYLGIADHSKSSRQARGLTEERLLRQVAEIEALNASRQFKTRVFAGTECDILPDGSLDFGDATLARLDYVVASVHSAFGQDEAVMTARIVRALEHPRTTMLGHLSGRLLLEREAYRVDAGKVIDAAIANGVAIELNANPFRLDMDWRLWKRAAERGLECSINPDAHHAEDLVYVRAGINAARKGWLTRGNVVNTLPIKGIEAWLAKKRGRR
ncbi:MAG TPA: DNA polymerase/3'-5' exonuclease PolX [Opitutaceae bacterium]|nr:DNA polymerase/3'-5' exonuclease PolX [Opitutaceae bacterium]